MKKILFFACILSLIGGCASSERALRMSGGILDSYSAPKSFRTRSEKFQKMDKMSIPHRANKPAVGGINETLVNIWPFYFRSNNYFSVLWPMIDWDPYGMAVRPFYNQEGDDYSILFPLSAWNVADKSGWVANVRWTANGFGFIPLSWQHRDENNFWCYYTPFFIMNRDYHQLGYDAKKNKLFTRNSNFTEFMLAFGGSERHLDTKDWSRLYWNNALSSDYVKYDLWKSGRKPLKTKAELTALRKEIAKTFVPYESTYGGFFPLFYLSRTPYNQSYSWNLLGLLATVNSSKNHAIAHVGSGWLYSYEFNQYPIDQAVRNGSKSHKKAFVLPLLSGNEETIHVKVTDTVSKLRALSYMAYREKFAIQLPKINAALKELDSSAQVPEFINNSTLLRLYVDDFIDDYCKKHKFEYYSTGKFNSPLYTYFWSPDKTGWFIFVLLTGAENNANGDWKWFSLPLLSGAAHNKSEDYKMIFPPFVYFNKTLRYDTVGKYIHASDAKWPDNDYSVVGSTDIYAACGLFYRGKTRFLVARNGLNYKTLNKLTETFHRLHRWKKELDCDEARYKKELSLANAIKDRNKIEYLEKLLTLEKLKQRRSALDNDQQKFNKLIADAKTMGKQVNFTFSVSNWADKKQLDSALRDLYTRTTAIREKSDIGNGLFFRRENYYNGDWQWKLLLGLAGGEKDGKKESSHVLHFLYRNRTEGDRQEKLIFPFISIQKDGKNSKTSFLGRIYQKSVINGKTSGYILFIPFG
ncbi:MAG: hypothetical protein IJY46_04775 [Lentisphaeria bacterium]|nr:hypothetical protein [Lentisphaeria bacterium]